MHLDRAGLVERRVALAGDEPAEERRQRDRGGDPEQQPRAAARQDVDVVAPLLGLGLQQVRRQLWRRPGRDQQVVHALQARGLLGAEVVAAGELVEGRAVAHPSSSSSSTARRPSAARVRVLTVPSGMFRNSAISDCESPLQ